MDVKDFNIKQVLNFSINDKQGKELFKVDYDDKCNRCKCDINRMYIINGDSINIEGVCKECYDKHLIQEQIIKAKNAIFDVYDLYPKESQ